MTRWVVAAVLPARGSGRARPPCCSRCSGGSGRRHRRDRDRLLPLGGHRSGPRDDTTVVLRSTGARYKPSGWSAGLFPLLFFGNNRAAATPSCSRCSGTSRPSTASTTALVPLFYWHRDRDGYAFGTPLLFLGNDRGDSYAIQFPLLWHFASERRGTSTTVTPIGYYHTDPDGWSLGVGPLVPLLFARSGKTRSHFALVPLIWHFADRAADRTTTVVGPYWHRRWGDETTDGLFPLLYYRRGARPGGSDETSFTLFPLVHYRRDAHTRVLRHAAGRVGARARAQRRLRRPLLLVRRQGAVAALHPVPAHRRDQSRDGRADPAVRAVVPDRRARTHRARALFPLFGIYTDEDETRHLGGARPTSACAGTTAIASTRCCRSTGGRRSAIGRRPSIGLYYDRTRAGRAQLRRRPAVLPRAQPGARASPSSRRC